MNSGSNNRNTVVNRRTFIKTAGVGSLAALAGCLGSSSSGNSKWENGKSIHYIGPPLESTWWRTMPAGHKIEAEQRGWTFTRTHPGWDAAKVNEHILSYAPNKDALIVNPVATDAHIQVIEQVWKEYNTPVAGNKDIVGGAVTHNIQSDDYTFSDVLVKNALEFIEEKYGTKKDKTLAHFQGSPDFTGWKKMIDRTRKLMKDHPEMNYDQIPTDGTVSGWSNAAQTYFTNNSPDAVISDSSGAFTRGIMDAMAANNQLYYVGHDKHIWLGGRDGYPSSLQYVRMGLQDFEVPQVPFAITMNISKLFHEQILDPSIQESEGDLPTVKEGTKIHSVSIPQPDGTPLPVYWGPEETATMKTTNYGVPTATVPPKVYGITYENVNEHNHWGNVFPGIMGRTDLMDVTFNAQGQKPDEIKGLLEEYETDLKNGEYGEELSYLESF